MKAIDRFEAKAERIPFSGCWIWVGARAHPAGYGHFWMCGRNELSHRASWRLYRGDIPTGTHVCHSCDVPACVNPSHLFLGDAKTNSDDKLSKGRHSRGVTCGKSKLNAEQVLAIFNSKDSWSETARKFGVERSRVAKIKGGWLWSSVTGRIRA